MSNYTEGQINEAIEIVQIALEDKEIRQYLSVSGWSEEPAWMVSCEHEFKAKKRPREFWVAIGEDFFEIEASEKDARNLYDAAVEVIKVREVLEEDD